MIPGSANPLLLASAETGAYAIERSVRFNSADSAYLSRTPASDGNRKTWTWAGWVKLCAVGTNNTTLFASGVNSSVNTHIRILSSSYLNLGHDGATIGRTDAVFRDPSAWYHIVVAVDSTQATQADRIKMYINGVNQSLSISSCLLNLDTEINNSAYTHKIGAFYDNSANYFLSGYLADVHFIDGQALDPTSFGEFDDNGIWQPIEYTGTYGANGFHLDFADNSTAAALGTDTSGNGNDWTPVNLLPSVTNYGDAVSSTPYGGSASAVLDLDLTNFVRVATSNYGTSFWTVTFSTPIPITSSVVCRVNASGANMFRIRINDTTDTIIGTTGQQDLTLNLGGASALSKLDFRTYAGSSYGANLYYIQVDGKTIYTGLLASQGDSFVDVPTNGTETDTGAGGEVRGNYCTWNPLAKGSSTTLSNGNLDMSSGSSWQSVVGTFGATSGKWYWEQTMTTNRYSYTGICNQKFLGNVESSFPGQTVNSWSYLTSNGLAKNDQGGGSQVSVTLTTMPSGGGTLGFALDLDNQKLWFALNGVWMGSGSPNPATGADPAFTNLVSGDTYFPCADVFGTSAVFNFGQRPFAYTAPSGFKALCTANLPAPVVTKPSEYMDVALYTGNGSTQTISGLEFSPDLVWIKNRAAADSHKLTDTVRGATEELESDTTAAEATNADGLTAFNSDGFDLGADAEYNTNTEAYVAWTWDAGANSSKTYAVTVVSDGGNKYRFDGHGTSAVTLDLEEGSTYTFDQSDSSNAGHPLRFSTTSDGTHGGGSEYTTGVTTVGTPGSAGASTTIVVASGAPTLYYYCSVHSGMGGQANTNSTAGASNFDGSITSSVRANPSAGFSIVTYTGNGTGGATVGHGLGVTPQFIIIKNRDSSASWLVLHTSAGLTGDTTHSLPEYYMLLLNSTSARQNFSADLIFPGNSTTFALGTGGSGWSNASGSDYVAYCFAPVDGYSSFGSYIGNGSADGPFVYTGFRPRFLLTKSSTGATNWHIVDSERGAYNVIGPYLTPNAGAVEGNYGGWDLLSNGFKFRNTGNTINSNGATYIYAAFAENPFALNARAR